MKRWAEGICEVRDLAKKWNRKQDGEMCAYIYYAREGGYIVMDEHDEPGAECGWHIETWQYGEISYSAV